MYKFLKMGFYLALILLVSCNTSTQQQNSTPQEFDYDVTPEEVGTTPEKIAELDAIMQSLIDEKKVPCAVGFVAKDGKVIYNKAFGYKNHAEKIPAQPDDFYILFSQTKAVVTVALMTLHEQGHFNLDDPVSKWLPDFPDEVLTKVNEDGTYETEPVNTPCTFAHLLSHSSGITGGKVRELQRIQAQNNPSAPAVGMRAPRTTVKDQVVAAMKYPLGFQPGSDWNYNIGVDVGAYIVEVITGKPLKDYLQETIFDPLGMDETAYYYTDESLKSRFVLTHSLVDGEFVPRNNIDGIFEPTTYFAGSLGLHGPVEDYAKFMQMIVNKGEFNGHRILKAETIKEMTTTNRLPEVNSGGEGFQFGIGFQKFDNDSEKKRVPEMSNSCLSWGGAMGTEYLIDPDNGLVILYYINMFGAPPTYNDYLEGVYGLFN